MNREIFIQKRTHHVKSLDDVQLCNNQVLCREMFENLDTPTKNGIIKGSYKFHKDQYLAEHANRVHEVVKVCHGLTFWTKANKVSGSAIRWRTQIEIEPGDTAWLSYPSVIDSDIIICGGVEYRLINYAEIRLVKKPNGKIVLVNGWVLYTHPEKTRSSILIDPKPEIDYSRGIVYMTGAPNEAYVVNDKKWVDLDGRVDIKEGDVFIKDNKANKLILEDPLFRYFEDKDLYLILRKNIIAVEQ